MDNSKLDVVELRRLQDYAMTFGSEVGKRVLADLQKRYLYVDAREHVAAGNSIGVVWIDSQRQLVGLIEKWSQADPKATVPKFEQPIEQGDPLHG